MTYDDVMQAVRQELEFAEQKHPVWPGDLLRQAVIVSEECGEALKEALTYVECNEKVKRVVGLLGETQSMPMLITERQLTRSRLRKEMAQTAAMAIRFLLHFNEHEKN